MGITGSASARRGHTLLLGLATLGFATVIRPGSALGQDSEATARMVSIYERPSRVEALQIPRVIRSLAIAPGMSVADIGAGSGLFTRPFARVVGGEGTVYAVDIDPDMLSHIEATARKEELDNVRTVLGKATDPTVPEPVELAFMCDMLHQVPDKAAYLEAVVQYLRPGGRIAVIDLEGNWPSRPDMHYGEADLEAMMTALGYVRVGAYDFVPAHFFVVYAPRDSR